MLFPVNCEKFVSLFAKHLLAIADGSTMEQLTVITVCTWLAFSSTACRLAPSYPHIQSWSAYPQQEVFMVVNSHSNYLENIFKSNEALFIEE